MPNNQDKGYFEHFLETLIPDNDKIIVDVKQAVEVFSQKKYCPFTPIRKQKALMHTWLAWQAAPGQPFGTALKVGSLNAQKENVSSFLKWIKNTFDF